MLAHWRRAHEDFFRRHLPAGRELDGGMPVVLECFGRLVPQAVGPAGPAGRGGGVLDRLRRRWGSPEGRLGVRTAAVTTAPPVEVLT